MGRYTSKLAVKASMSIVRAPKEALPAAFADRIAGALWGMHIGDALAMPSHWFYGGNRQVQQTYGGDISGYVKPPMELQGSIMNKSNTGGAGRGGFDGEIIGAVINHDKKKYWSPGKSIHYHCTLKAGENTLDCDIAQLCYNNIAANGGSLSPSTFVQRYVEFMTTPGTHNDCYAATYHRMFFANRESGKPLEQCPDNDGHNVDTQDGLTVTIPVALATAAMPENEAQRAIAESSQILRKSPACAQYSWQLGSMLRGLMADRPLAEVLEDVNGRSLAHTLKSSDPVVA